MQCFYYFPTHRTGEVIHRLQGKLNPQQRWIYYNDTALFFGFATRRVENMQYCYLALGESIRIN